jgi:signal transduction histidine kinase
MSEFKTSESEEILIVDDTELNCNILKAILVKEGYKVVCVNSGKDCLEYCEKKLPQTILLDIMMPEISGLDVCKILREKYSKQKLPIILVSALTESADIKNGLLAGANDYVTKPVDRGVLLARIVNQLYIAESYRKIAEQQKTIAFELKIQQATGDALDQAILVHNQAGKILYSNKVFSEYCNSQEQESALEALLNIFNGRMRDVHGDFLKQIEQDPVKIINYEFFENTRGRLNVQIVSRPVDFSANNDICRIWVWRDLSHMRELEKQMSEKVKLETVSIFALGVAHNFNNLMAAILGASEKLAKTSSNNSTAEKCLKIIKKAINNGSALTKKMSGLGKRANSMAGPQEVELKPVIDSLVEVYSLHGNKEITFELDAQLNKVWLQMEYLNLLDILSHIIGNSADAISQTGKIAIDIFESGQFGYIDIALRDNGCGMSPEVKARVFEPFFSTKNLDNKNGVSMVGNGLGLWNVYNIVKLFNGEIKINSVLGEGTEIILTLPGVLKEEMAVDSAETEIVVAN